MEMDGEYPDGRRRPLSVLTVNIYRFIEQVAEWHRQLALRPAHSYLDSALLPAVDDRSIQRFPD